jgi:hypothetical protein
VESEIITLTFWHYYLKCILESIYLKLANYCDT